jgi:hypothetical protein
MKDWDYEEIDYLRLMKAYLEELIDVDTFRRQLFAMNAKRSLLSEEASEIILKAYSKTDQYDPLLRLPDTIEEPELRHFVSNSVKRLEALGHRLEDPQKA